jgi:hypothetical protein
VSDLQGERDLTASIRELAATLERDLRDHPAPEELQDFLAGDLPADQRERIEEHLALCRDCARVAVELAEIPETDLGKRGELVTEAEIEAQWKRFQAAVAPARRRPRAIEALAAVLLLALLGLAAWALIREMTQPQTDVAIVDLFPADKRGPEDVVFVSLPPWAGRIALTLNPAKDLVYPEYRVEIRGPGGRRIWSTRKIQPDEKGTFVVVVPRRLLPEGVYQIHLSGPGGGPVEDFDLEIGPPQNQ